MEHLSKFIEEDKELFWELDLDEFRWPHGRWEGLTPFSGDLESTILTFVEKNVKVRLWQQVFKKTKSN